MHLAFFNSFTHSLTHIASHFSIPFRCFTNIIYDFPINYVFAHRYWTVLCCTFMHRVGNRRKIMYFLTMRRFARVSICCFPIPCTRTQIYLPYSNNVMPSINYVIFAIEMVAINVVFRNSLFTALPLTPTTESNKCEKCLFRHTKNFEQKWAKKFLFHINNPCNYEKIMRNCF